ncbi:MAP7 domain-containing protein [Cupriavidus pauculus]|uniref:MAP7 domain-containing protein n=1 Tax=Cupriavidus pauculus TaxID=82633 RepID=UPI001EE25053|nr:MAP7 domain-containing protein [Cupriavidus pauculus]GJG98187.1 hypothetical protein CBA19C6_26880 [Cupriavidus pauculus]
MKQKVHFGKSGGKTVLMCLPVVVASTVMSPAGATDWAALQRGFEALRPLAQQMDRDSENRRRQQEQEEARKEAERQRKLASEAQAKSAEAQRVREDLARREAATQRENALLSPPPEWAPYPVLNRRVFERKATLGPNAAIQVTARSQVAFSDDGSLAAYVNGRGEFVLRKLANGEEQVLRSDFPLDDIYFFQILGNRFIATSGTNPEVFDLTGKSLAASYRQSAAMVGNRLVVVDYANTGGLTSACKSVSEFDASGALLSRVDVSAEGYAACHVSTESTSQVQFIAQSKDSGAIHYYVGGVKVSAVNTAGTHISPLADGMAAAYRYKDATSEGGELWDLRAAKKLCDLPKDTILWGRKGRLLQWKPAAVLDPASCGLTSLRSGNVTSIDDDYVTTFDEDAAAVSIFDTKAMQLVKRITVPKSGKMAARRLKGTSTVAVGPAYFGNESGGVTQVYDIKTGNLLQEAPGWLNHTGAVTSDDIKADKNTARTTKIWRLQTQTANADFTKFVESLKRDKYETSAEYRKRAEKASFPYQLDIDVKDYHADGSYFEAVYQGVSFGVPMPPAQARKLDGQARLTVSGQLRMLDDEFVIMRNATIRTADGTTVAVPETKVPARRTPSGAGEATLKGGMQLASAGANGGAGGAMAVKTGGKAAGSCTGDFGYMASQLPAYTDSNLATIRSSLLSQNVMSLAAELKGQGRTVSALDEPIAEGERVAAEAEQTANQTHGGSGPSSIQQARNGTLPLSFQCTGIHNSAVCAYIINKWSAQFYREAKARLSQCA